MECKYCGLTGLYTEVKSSKLKEFYQNYKNQAQRIKVENIRKKNIYPEKLNKLKRLTIGKKLLDIGAGLGTFAALAQENGFDVTGVELSRDQCQYAKEVYGLNLINHNIFEIDDRLGTFDVIHLHHVLEHLTSPASMLEIAHNHLKTNGILLIEVPFQLERIQDKIKKKLPNLQILNRLYDPIPPKMETTYPLDHLFFFTPKTMERYLTKNGFKCIEFRQHRKGVLNEKNLSCPQKYIKASFYSISTALKLPSGSFLEFYCKKAS